MELHPDATQIIYRREAHRFFDELVTLLANMAGVSASLMLQRVGHREPYGPAHLFTMLGMGHQVPIEMAFRPVDVLGPISRDEWPEALDIVTRPLRQDRAEDPFRFPGLQGVIGAMLQAAFVRYFEIMRPEIHARYGPDYRTWHETLNFARIVRNACAHGGTLNFNTPTSLGGSWRGITYTAPDHGHQILFSEVGPVELILLMEEMDALF